MIQTGTDIVRLTILQTARQLFNDPNCEVRFRSLGNTVNVGNVVDLHCTVPVSARARDSFREHIQDALRIHVSIDAPYPRKPVGKAMKAARVALGLG